jgi:hypothetical protein
MAQRPGAHKNPADDDRRRSRRFACGGEAKISLLPSDGIYLPGKILDLSLHGCRVDTSLPIDFGVRAEILLRVNAASFRAVGEVKALRGGSGAGIEFVQLSSGGKDMLGELLAELARLQGVMNKLKAARREADTESLRRELEVGTARASLLSSRFSLVGKVLPTESTGQKSEESTLENSTSTPAASTAALEDANRTAEASPLVIAVNLFV